MCLLLLKVMSKVKGGAPRLLLLVIILGFICQWWGEQRSSTHQHQWRRNGVLRWSSLKNYVKGTFFRETVDVTDCQFFDNMCTKQYCLLLEGSYVCACVCGGGWIRYSLSFCDTCCLTVQRHQTGLDDSGLTVEVVSPLTASQWHISTHEANVSENMSVITNKTLNCRSSFTQIVREPFYPGLPDLKGSGWTSEVNLMQRKKKEKGRE